MMVMCGKLHREEQARNAARSLAGVLDRVRAAQALTPSQRCRLAHERLLLVFKLTDLRAFDLTSDFASAVEAELLSIPESQRTAAWELDLVNCLQQNGSAHRARRKLPEALKYFSQQESRAEQYLVKRTGQAGKLAVLHASGQFHQADTLRKMGRWRLAGEQFLRARTSLQKLRAARPHDLAVQQMLAECSYFAGDAMSRSARNEEALALWEDAIREFQQFVDVEKDRDGYRDHLLEARRKVAHRKAAPNPTDRIAADPVERAN